MNPDIQKELLGWLQGLRQAVEAGAAFAQDQIPQVLWEKVLLGRVYHSVMLLLSLVCWITVFYFAFTLLPRLFQAVSDASRKDEDPLLFKATAGIVLGITALITGIATFVENIYPFILVWTAPRLYIIEWLRELIK